MKKTVLALILCISLIFSLTVLAEENVTVMIDGKELVCDVAPQLVNSRTMLPMRAIFEALGAEVNWVGEDELIFATKDDCLITLKIGEPVMSLQKIGNNENTVIQLDVAPFLYNSRTMVPARAVAEALSAKVDWVDETRTVIITQ